MGDSRGIEPEWRKGDNVVMLPGPENRVRALQPVEGEAMGRILLFTGVRYERMPALPMECPEPLSSGGRSSRRRR